MKKLLLFILLLAPGLRSVAQDFAPVGAEWFYEADHGVFRATVTEQKVINGITCRAVAFKPFIDSLWKSRDFHLQMKPVYYVYNNLDTVFIYNAIFSKFTPLYIFNVQQGDTVNLPLLMPNDAEDDFAGNWGDSTFSYIVDSVKMVVYDTTNLKTVFTHSLKITGKQEMSFYAYAETLGALETGIMPKCIGCASILDESLVGPGGVRCYHDSSTSIKLVQDDCARNIYLDVPVVLQNAVRIELYPNPATDKVSVRFDAVVKNCIVALQDMDGKAIMVQQAHNTREVSFDVSALPAGVYFVKVTDGGNEAHMLKFVKAE
jgi:hypothetical protein